MYSFRTGNSGFILRRGLGVAEVQVQVQVQVRGRQEQPEDSTNIQSPRDQYLLGIFATDVVRKVGLQPNGLAFSDFRSGHWIQDCPTNNDPEYDKKRIKRTTGIPRSFLKSVEPTEGAPLAQGVMVTPDGGYVIAQPDTYVSTLSFYTVRIRVFAEPPGRSKRPVQRSSQNPRSVTDNRTTPLWPARYVQS